MDKTYIYTHDNMSNQIVIKPLRQSNMTMNVVLPQIKALAILQQDLTDRQSDYLNELLEAIIAWSSSLPKACKLKQPSQLRDEVNDQRGTRKFAPLYNILADIDELPNNAFGQGDTSAFDKIAAVVAKYT
jgi:hypothetical protein